jgi:hypothetical protein
MAVKEASARWSSDPRIEIRVRETLRNWITFAHLVAESSGLTLRNLPLGPPALRNQPSAKRK